MRLLKPLLLAGALLMTTGTAAISASPSPSPTVQGRDCQYGRCQAQTKANTRCGNCVSGKGHKYCKTHRGYRPK